MWRSADVVGWALVLTAALAAQSPAPDAPPAIDAGRFLADVKYLASDELEGRANGTPGLARAAQYVAGEFRRAGLEPAGDDGSFEQPFDVPARLEPDVRQPLVVAGPGGDARFTLGADFYPMAVLDGTDGGLPVFERARVVFAGYGITAPELGYDDYTGLDVTGAAVVVFTHEPQEQRADSRFDGNRLTPHADLARKAAVAAARGAGLLVVVEDPSHVVDRAVTPGWARDPQIGPYALPVVRVDRERLGGALGLGFAADARAIDRDLRPRSRVVSGATLSYRQQLGEVRARVSNIIGILRGADLRLADEAIVVGAHYDHVGLGGPHSMAPYATGEIHNGADDNASGTAALLELARAAVRGRERFGRTLVFVAFAGEEIGLLGSAAYLHRPAVPIQRTVAMVNLDMIGRPLGRVLVGGTERAPRFARLIDSLRGEVALRIDDFSQGGYRDGSSDDASFRRAGVPALAFFTGFHGDYHRPTDDWQRLDVEGAAEVTRLALLVVERLSR
ncbi:MAG: M28 family peptidase [Acidobacteriota bacterium]